MAESPTENSPEDAAAAASDAAPAADAGSPEAAAELTTDLGTPDATPARRTPVAGPVVSSLDTELERLPTYARGLLQIRVPIQVTLASQRKSVQEIVELGPGSIVKFDKTCGEPLELCIGSRTIAEGEVVKVGDKFGLRISGLAK